MVAACALALVGCSSSAKEETAPTVSTSPSPTPAPTPSATSAVNDESDTALGITFGAPPALEGDAAEAYNWISVYEKAYWRTLTTNVVDAGMDLFTSPEALADVQKAADTNASIQAQIRGNLHVVISDVATDGNSATGTACEDYSNATFADATRTYTPEEAGFAPPELQKFTLVGAEGRWIVQSVEKVGTC